MEQQESALRALQQRLSLLIRAPSGALAALAAEGDAAGESLAGWIVGDTRASAGERLEVYANAYFARLHGALREDYPALAAALGTGAFHDLATAYLLGFPPSRPSLRDAGASLAAFLAGPSAEAAWLRVRWPFAADLAAFEWALVEAFDAPDAPALERAALAALGPEQWETLALRLHPAASLLEFGWPVQRLREVEDAGQAAPALAPEPTRICVSRRGERVRFRAVPPAEAALLAELARGIRFGEVCARLAASLADDAAASEAARLLSRWIDDGLVRGDDSA
jgi:hypothetical protein